MHHFLGPSAPRVAALGCRPSSQALLMLGVGRAGTSARIAEAHSAANHRVFFIFIFFKIIFYRNIFSVS